MLKPCKICAGIFFAYPAETKCCSDSCRRVARFLGMRKHVVSNRIWISLEWVLSQCLPIPESGCLIWERGDERYKSITVDNRRIPLHRWTYEQTHGPIPDGYQIDHLCRVTWCINPYHLEAVTPRVNTLRSTSPAALNAAKTNCSRCGRLFDEANTVYHGVNRARACRACCRRKNYIWACKTRLKKYYAEFRGLAAIVIEHEGIVGVKECLHGTGLTWKRACEILEIPMEQGKPSDQALPRSDDVGQLALEFDAEEVNV